MRFLGLIVSAAVAPLVLCATSLRSPVSGYLFDAEKGVIRPLNGLPGSAMLGGVMEAPERMAKVFFSPRQNAALAVSASKQLYYVTLDGQTAVFTPLGDLEMDVDLAAFRPDGRSAAVFEAATRRIRPLTGLPGAPAAGDVAVLDVAGEVAALALDPSARTLAVAARTGESAAVYAVSIASGAAEFVSDAISVDSLSFSQAGELLFTDRGADRVMTASASASGWRVSVVADGRDGLAGPAGAEFAMGAVVILAGSEVVVQQGGTLTRLALPVRAKKLTPMAAPGLLYLEASGEPLGASPLHLIELAGQARVVFVPAGGVE